MKAELEEIAPSQEQAKGRDSIVRKKLAKLIDVKSIVTLIMTMVFAALAIFKAIDGQEFLTVFTVVIAFYFGTQATKNKEV